MAWRFSRAESDPQEVRRALPGDPEDLHSRYIEGTISGVIIGCLYLPNGNPAPGPKFEYKLRWLERLITHAAELVSQQLARRARWRLQRDPHGAGRLQAGAVGQRRPVPCRDARGVWPPHAAGLEDAVRTLHPDATIYTFWDYFRDAYGRDAGCASTTCC